MRLAWAALLVAASLLVGLRIGRPVYYTDGERELSGADLAASGMVEWGTPEASVELPGPVQGRVAELPDGRLLYGRSLPDGTTDLVVFDPRRPAVQPEPAYGLNSAQNDLAPAVTADGRVYFASDREGGVGGYDLYVAQWSRAGFGAPAPLPVCNTALDESDPAPAPNGLDFVFVRIDRQIDGGANGSLYRARLDDGLEPRPVFEVSNRRNRVSCIDRDPAFAPDGGALWFVRKQGLEPLRVVRASLCKGVFDAPVVIGTRWGTAVLRAPQPSADGLRLGLLQPRSGEETSALWFVAAAREVYPWWPGQRWLEWVLLGVVITCLVLLLLLHFGQRWSTLDLVAQCLLLSLLLHILLFLWLMGVEITGALLPGADDGGSMQVSVVMEASVGGAAGDGPQQADLAAMVQFTPETRELTAAAPGAAVERAAAGELEGPQGAWTREAEAQEVAAAAAALLDAAATVTPRAGVDAVAATQAAPLPQVQASAQSAAALAAAARAAADPGVVTVAVPGTSFVAADPSPALAGPAAARAERDVPAVREVSAPRPALADAAAPSPALVPLPSAANGEAPAAVERSLAAASPAAPDSAASNDAAEAVREAGSAPAPSAAIALVAPGAALARPAAETLSGPVAKRQDTMPAPAATRRSLAAPLRDAPSGDASLANATAPAAKSASQPAPSVVPSVSSSVSSSVARAEVRPALAAVAGPAAASVLVAPRATDDGQKALPAAAAPVPSASLERAASSVPLATNRRPDAELPRPQVKASIAVVMQDTSRAAPSAAATAAATPSAAVARSASRIEPLAGAALQQPRPVAFDRPQRHAGFGALGTLPVAVTAPGSLLERPVSAPVLAPASAIPVAATPYSNRFGPAKAQALEQFGGTADTERAVANGLRYLAKLQNRDGSWGNRDAFDSKYGAMYVGKTALCVLAFLGAGHTPVSKTEHSDVVQRALTHLLTLQDEDTGAFGASSCYGHGITTYALAECYGLTKDPALRRPLEEALSWILQNQGPRRDKKNRGGWGYFSPGLQPEDDYARVSVTSWMVMALESARLSGIDLPEQALPRAREYLEQSFDTPNGWFRYAQKPSRLNSAWPTLPASTPAGAFCLQLLGAAADDRMVAAGVEYTVSRRPEEYRRYNDDEFVLRGQGNVYFWYYGSLCCFLAGGDAWQAWNERLRTVLPQAQAEDGSFPPIDTYAREAGDTRRDRSYTTAMCVLSLEVYYRYFTPLLTGRPQANGPTGR
ncbi:MAG: PD40 domain-containing protein [Planctomycetes bacterium]|nr:PD40 domain-containing protein [Planctomycetota bacterium]